MKHLYLLEELEAKNPYKKGGMFEAALHLIFENAKNNRNNPTAAETVLWMHLRTGLNGYKFRRQHPIGMFIADFYCHKTKLVIEVDGNIHQTIKVMKADKEKEEFLERNGYRILRFTNEEVFNKIEVVVEKIKNSIK